MRKYEMDERPIIFNIQRGCVHDGPGVRTCIFFSGCLLHCAWCSNPESQSGRPHLFLMENKCIGCGSCVQQCTQGAFERNGEGWKFHRENCVECGACTLDCCTEARTMLGREYSIPELIQAAEKDMPFYKASGGGITFTGGEAALWPETVRAVAAWYREHGCSTAIETCGYAPWKNYERFLPEMDLVLFDIKLWDSERHRNYCGAENGLIFENLEKIAGKCPTIIRMPIITGINDSEAELRQIAAYLCSLCVIREVHILPYHNLAIGKYQGLGRYYTLPELKPPPRSHMEWIRSLLEEYDLKVSLGG